MSEAARGWDGRRALWAMRASFAMIPLWLAATWTAHARGPEGLWLALDLPFRLACHRVPERVPTLAGVPWPLCSRCLGLWLGLSVGACFGWPALPLPWARRALLAALLVMWAQIALQDLGVLPVSHALRLLTGWLVTMPLGGLLGATAARQFTGAR